MRVCCRYCGKIFNDKKIVCPHCGGEITNDTTDWDTTRWSPEIYKIAADYCIFMDKHPEVALEGSYVERTFCLPTRIYTNNSYPNYLGMLIKDWATRMRLNYYPEIWSADDLSITGGMWLTVGSLIGFYRAYKLMPTILWRQLLMEIMSHGIQFDKISIEDVSSYGAINVPPSVYVYDYDSKLISILKTVFNYVSKEPGIQNMSLTTEVEHINSFHGDKVLIDVTWDDLCLYAGMPIKDAIRFGSGFIGEEEYDFIESMELVNVPYLRHGSGLSYPLPRGAIIRGMDNLDPVEYNERIVKIDKEHKVICKNTDPLAFNAVYEQVGGVKGTLAGLLSVFDKVF